MKKETSKSLSNMTRRTLLRTTSLVAGTAIAAPMIWQKRAWAAGEVNVLAFGGYEEPGMLEPFEEATGIKVNLKIHDGSDEEMVALVGSSEAGTFDIITPTSAYVPRAAKDGLLAELTPRRFPALGLFRADHKPAALLCRRQDVRPRQSIRQARHHLQQGKIFGRRR